MPLTKSLTRSLSLLVLLTFAYAGLSVQAAARTGISIVPKPKSMVPGAGAFTLTAETEILTERGSKDAAEVGGYLRETLRPATGFTLKLSKSRKATPVKGAIFLTSRDADPSLGDEGYELSVTKDGVLVRAPHPAGLFYGVQTLRQLLPPEIHSAQKSSTVSWSLPCVTVRDRPRFAWRGLHFDPARHFFDKERIKQYIDYLAMHKLNTMHVHFTDDQGWRIEIKKYPKLTEIGAWREESIDINKVYDGTPHGGFFTQDDIRELIAYAESRFVTIVPEIELPGHAQAAAASYPWLSCTGGPHKVWTRWGISPNVFCGGNEETLVFLENVLTEVADLFPSTYIHIGGDECPKKNWEECAKCQQRIKDENLKDESELQSYVTRRMERLLNAKGKRLIGWDEILEGGLAPNATVMSWRGTEGGIAAAKAGHDVVMNPHSETYFNYKEVPGDGPGHNGNLPLKRVYAFEPLPDALTAEQQKHILGAQACLWTEYIPTWADVQFLIFPRASAIAEVVWSPRANRDWLDFRGRLDTQYKRYDAMGVNYRSPDTYPKEKR